jgi:hypothetical protein
MRFGRRGRMSVEKVVFSFLLLCVNNLLSRSHARGGRLLCRYIPDSFLGASGHVPLIVI